MSSYDHRVIVNENIRRNEYKIILIEFFFKLNGMSSTKY